MASFERVFVSTGVPERRAKLEAWGGLRSIDYFWTHLFGARRSV